MELFRKCLESLKVISVPFEVLLIDDGSDEETAFFCTKLCGSNIRFRYYRQENQGVSGARNNGIQHTVGKYIFFLDADDMIPPEFGKFLEENYQRLTADWIIFEVKELDPTTGIVRNRESFPTTETLWTKKGALTELFCQSKVNESWGKLIRRTVLTENKISFPSNSIQGEDATFNIRLLKAVSSIQTIPCPGYLYHYEKNTLNQRVLRNPERYFYSLQVYYCEKRELIGELLDGVECTEYLEQWKIATIEETGSTVLKLWKGRCFSEEVRKIVQNYLKVTGCMDNIFIGKIKSLKVRIYYELLKHDLWWGFYVLSLFKS